VVVAALEEMKRYLAVRREAAGAFTPTPLDMLLDRLIARGRNQLATFLPHESPPVRRLADGALLFLLYPMEVVDAAKRERPFWMPF